MFREKKKCKLGETTKRRSSEFLGGNLRNRRTKFLVKFWKMTKKRSSEIFDTNWYGEIFYLVGGHPKTSLAPGIQDHLHATVSNCSFHQCDCDHYAECRYKCES